jgi:hypothetical protein
MTKQELYEMDFETACEYLRDYELDGEIKTYNELKEIAVDEIRNDNLFYAKAILDDISNRNEYYHFEESGIVSAITPLNCLQDLEQFCED